MKRVKMVKKNPQAQRYAYMKKRVAKMRKKAKNTGLLYLLGLVLLTALVCVPNSIIAGFVPAITPILTLNDAAITTQLSVLDFWKVFTTVLSGIDGKEVDLIVALLYAIMLLTLLVNLIRALGKLGWLCKKKASRLYGFNRNAYAMDDISKIYASSFSSIVITHLTILFLAESGTVGLTAWILLGVGLLFHFVCGIRGGNVSVFDTENGIVENKREIGTFVPFMRNLFQFAAIAGIVYFYINFVELRSLLDTLFAGGIANIMNNVTSLTSDLYGLIVTALNVLSFVWIIVMIKHATSTKEYDMEGLSVRGRKNYGFAAFMTFAFAVGMIVVEVVLLKGDFATQTDPLLIAVIAFVGMILDGALAKKRKVREDDANVDDIDFAAYLSESVENA